jgi:hypothetical protein
MGRWSIAWEMPPARPESIPANPDQVYSQEWQGLSDYIGSAKPKNFRRTWRPFEDARRYVRALELSSVQEYGKWCKGELKNKPKRPDDIPTSPYESYREDKNWRGMADFLGSKPSAKYVQMWPFVVARSFVRKLKLTSPTEYSTWAASRHKPPEVPVVPFKKYSNEWRGWNDWLGQK